MGRMIGSTMMGDRPTPGTGDDLLGRTIGHYQILRELGRGGMATVYLARQTNMNRQVAIKVLPRHFLHDPTFLERFKREVQLIAELEHPHILPVYDFGEVDGIPYIVMRYLSGGSMLDLLIDGLPPLANLEKPIQQVCAALDFAHSEGIIHRDLKPSNIMLDEHGNAYLSDFGIAQIMQDAGRLTGSALIGTPAYMSPEQAEGRPLDARSDVYALGVVLFEMVTGREPFQADTPMAMLLKQIAEPMPSPRAYRPDLPVAVEQVILRATLKDPAMRYPSAGALAAAFSQALRTISPEQSSVRLPRPPSTEITRLPRREAPTEAEMVSAVEDLPTVLGAEDLAAPTMPAARAAQRSIPAEKSTPAAEKLPAAPAGEAAVAPRVGRRRWVGALAGILIVLLLAFGAVRLLRNNWPGGSLSAAEPTPFPGAVLRTGPDRLYRLAVPGDWQERQLPVEDGLAVLWAPEDDSAFVALRLTPLDAAEALAALIERHNHTAYGDERLFVPIDRAEQPDGQLRVSYRIPQPGTLYDRFGPGQLDLFYSRAGSQLVTLAFFTSDSADVDTLLPVLQEVLDSVVLNLSG